MKSIILKLIATTLSIWVMTAVAQVKPGGGPFNVEDHSITEKEILKGLESHAKACRNDMNFSNIIEATKFLSAKKLTSELESLNKDKDIVKCNEECLTFDLELASHISNFTEINDSHDYLIIKYKLPKAEAESIIKQLRVLNKKKMDQIKRDEKNQ